MRHAAEISARAHVAAMKLPSAGLTNATSKRRLKAVLFTAVATVGRTLPSSVGRERHHPSLHREHALATSVTWC